MRLGFHGATTMTSDLETDIKATQHGGFRYLELWAAKLDRYLAAHSLDALGQLLKAHGVTPTAINSIEFIAFRNQAEFATIRERCRELSRIAQAIGCANVVVVPSPLPDRSLQWSAIVDEYVRVLRDLSAIAAEYGVRLCFEFLGFGWCTVRTPRACWEIVQKADRPNIGMTVDAAHFYGGGGLLNELDSIDPARIYTFHLDDLEDTPKEAITDATRLLPGTGVVPLADLCARLKRIGFDGQCSVELFRPEYWQWNPMELATAVRESALKVLTPYFKVE
jgi:2-keto-myo-inositol isomerase